MMTCLLSVMAFGVAALYSPGSAALSPKEEPALFLSGRDARAPSGELKAAVKCRDLYMWPSLAVIKFTFPVVLNPLSRH